MVKGPWCAQKTEALAVPVFYLKLEAAKRKQHSYVCRMIIKAKIPIFIFSHIINYWEGEGALGRPEQQLPVQSSRTLWPFVNFLAIYSISSPKPARCSPCQAASVPPAASLSSTAGYFAPPRDSPGSWTK